MSKNKKVIGATAVASGTLALLLGTTTFAAVPTTNGTIVIGSKAYSMDYMMSVTDSAKINAIRQDIAAAGDNLFYSFGQGTWKDVMTGTTTLTEDQLATKLGVSTVTYVKADGTTSTETIGTQQAALSVSSVSAINANDFTFGITFTNDSVVPDYTGKTVTLTNGSNVLTANYVNKNGQTTVWQLSTGDISKVKYNSNYNGDYAISGAVTTTSTTSYRATLANTAVEGLVFDGDTPGNPAMSGVKVSVGDKSTLTDETGYYNLGLNAGKLDVVLSKDGYFSQKITDTTLERNNSTALNNLMYLKDEDKIFISGTVLDSVTGKPISVAAGTDPVVVALQAQNSDGTWSTINVASLSNTDGTSGKFIFANHGATLPTDDATMSTVKATSATDDFLKMNTNYQVVISRGLSSTNLAGAYETKTIPVTTSNDFAETDVFAQVRPIAKLDSLKLDLAWDGTTGAAATAPVSTDKVKVELIAPASSVTNIANNVLATLTKSCDTTGDAYTKFTVDANNKTVFDLVPMFETSTPVSGVNNQLALPNGNYYVRITHTDSTNTIKNSVTVVPITIQEGKAYETSSDVVIRKASNLAISGVVSSITYNESFGGSLALTGAPTPLLKEDTTGTAARATNVTGVYNIYKTIDGKDVLVATSTSPINFSYDNATSNKISFSDSFGFIAKDTYKIVPVSDYITGATPSTVTVDSASVNATSSFKSGSTVTVKATLAGGSALGTTDVANIQLLDVNGNVAYSSGAVAGLTVTPATGDGTISYTFKNVAPGYYKAKVIGVDGYVDNTSDKNQVLDFQDKTETLTLAKQDPVKVTGYVQFTDNYTMPGNNEATVTLYDATGKVADFANTDASGTYTLNTNVSANKAYTLVVRGKNMETYVQKNVVLKQGANTINLSVQRGGKGNVELSLLDSNGLPLKNSGVAIAPTTAVSITDGYNTSLSEAGAPALSGMKFDGAYEVNNTSTPDGKTFTLDGSNDSTPTTDEGEYLSKGQTYTITVGASDSTNKFTDTFTLSDINAKEYKPESIPVKYAGVTYTVSGTVTSPATADPGLGKAYVVALQNGKVVAQSSAIDIATPGTAVNYSVKGLKNGTYTIAVMVNGTFVSTFDQTVQGFDVANVNFNLKATN